MSALAVQNLYQSIYLLIILFFTLSEFKKYRNKYGGLPSNGNQTSTINSIDPKTLILPIVIALWIGLRPHRGFGDSTNYIHMYNRVEGLQFNVDLTVENLIWDNFFNWWASRSFGITFFFIIVALLYFILAFIACRKLFPNDYYPVYLLFLGAFSTFSYGTNGIKAGLAASIFLFAISYYRNWKLCILLAILSYGFHHSMQLPVAALIMTYIYKNTKFYFVFWFFCLLIACAHIETFANFFAGMSDDSAARYLQSEGGEDSYITGFRPDFILYSAMPVLVGYYAVFKKKLVLSDTYKRLLNIYLCTNGVWMLCMYASYTNRIAYLSWFMYPIVLTYPYLNEKWGQNKYKIFAKIMLVHIGFTLFMHFIYY